jgi:hypothetical protein
MKKHFYHLIFFFFLCFKLSAQKLNAYQDKYVRDVIAHQFCEISDKVELECGMANFCILNRDTFFNIMGFHYLFQLKGDSIERLDHSMFHGTNFNRFLFTDSHTVFLLGGYGMFVTNNNLEAFNFKTREWYIKATTGPKPPFICGFTFKKGNYVYTFNNFKDGNYANPNEFYRDLFRLDLSTFKWEKFENLNTNLDFVINNVVNKKVFLYSKDYFIDILGNKFIIINTKSLTYLIIDNFGLENNENLFKIHLNQLYIKNINSSHTAETEQLLDLDSLYKTHQKLAIPLVLTPNWWQNFYFKYSKSIYIILLLLLLVFVFYYVFKKLNKKAKGITKTLEPQIQNIEKTHPLIEAILASSKTELSADELDNLLGIFYMEQESKKMKRHRLIIQLNEIYPNLISRKKELIDKRKTIYIINQKLS